MRGTRRYDFDLVLAGNFRASGEVAETMASHLAALAGASLEIGLLWLRDPALVAAPVQRRIAGLVREHTAVPIPPDADGLSCRLVLVYEPRLLAANGPRLRADLALVVLVQQLLQRGAPAFDVAAAASLVETLLAPRQLWCPATPSIRAQCREHAAGLATCELDLPPLEPIPA
jgi:hypothetical protein